MSERRAGISGERRADILTTAAGLRRAWAIAVDVVGTLIVMAAIGLLLGVVPVRASEPAPAWPQIERTRSDGACLYAGRIEAGEAVRVTCLTGLPPSATVVPVLETGHARLSGWFSLVSAGEIAATLRNEAPRALDATVALRVHLAPAAPPHPCSVVPLMRPTPTDICVARQCAAGRNPLICTSHETGAPAAGTAGAN